MTQEYFNFHGITETVESNLRDQYERKIEQLQATIQTMQTELERLQKYCAPREVQNTFGDKLEVCINIQYSLQFGIDEE